jgi:DNA primase catalytic core
MRKDIHAEELKRSINLVEFLEHKGIFLKKQGQSFSGLCPFHKDTKPSFTVDPEKNLWHCFGCDKGGDVFTFLQELEGLTFAQALEQLQPYNPESPKSQVSRATREQAKSLKPGKTVNTQEILNRVVEYYHQTFYEDIRGLEYLRDRRNIHDRTLCDAFKIGFANGSIFKMLPESGEVVDTLKKLGIITAKGKEFFHHSVIFPIFNEDGQVTEIYGRVIDEKENSHLYLKGPHKGVFNWQAAKRSTEILLTESIIDALSLYQAGYRDVIPLYGVNGLTQDHLSLFEKYGTKKLFIVFDNDPPGHDACLQIARTLSPVECLKVTLPVKDANDFFLTHTADDFVPLLARAEPVVLSQEERFHKEKLDESFSLRLGNLCYMVKPVQSFDEKLRVTVKAVYGDKIFLDTLDLYSHKSRQSAINQISKKFELSKEKVEKHFTHIIEETEQFQKEKESPEKEKEKSAIMSQEEADEALSFLSSSTLVEEIMADLDIIGYVGEPSNKILAYLIGISRKLDRPLSGIISSSSGAGKSHLAELIEQLTPPEDVILFSRLSPQALGYMEKGFLRQKLLIIEERKGSEAADYSIRTLQTRHKLTQGIVVKDPSSGRMYTKTYTVEGPIAYLETTTDGAVNPENSTRCFELYLDESAAQTGKVHLMQRVSRTLEGLSRDEHAQHIIHRHQNAQRLLKSVKVVIPYAPLLTFPSEWLRTRRDNERFLCLIEAVCFLHQYQREMKQLYENGSRIDYIEATVEDYRIAYELAKEVLTQTLHDLKKHSRELLSEITIMVEEKADAGGNEPHEIVFSRREVREYTKWSDWKVRECLSQLVDLEYLRPMSGSQGKLCVYQLSDSIPYQEFSLNCLLSPEKLAEKLQKGNDYTG